MLFDFIFTSTSLYIYIYIYIQVKYTCDSTIQPFDCYAVICVEEKGAPRVGYRLAVSRVWVAIELRLRDLGEDLLQ